MVAPRPKPRSVLDRGERRRPLPAGRYVCPKCGNAVWVRVPMPQAPFCIRCQRTMKPAASAR